MEQSHHYVLSYGMINCELRATLPGHLEPVVGDTHPNSKSKIRQISAYLFIHFKY
jgi:hypothetical protein